MYDTKIKQFLRYLFLSSSEDKFEYNDKLDFELFLPIATRNRVTNIMFYGLKNISKENAPSIEIVNRLQSDCMLYGVKAFHQEKAFKDIANEYEKENLKLTVIKGQILKSLYLKNDMRVMGDIDFIVPKNDYLKGRKILVNKLGYVIEHEDKDELCAFNSQKVCVELHQHLVTELSNNQKYFDKTYLSHTIKKENYYVLDEDYHFIYMMDHIYKHFIDGGLGLKYILDFALFIKKYPDVIKNTFDEINNLSLANLTLGFLQICNDCIGFDVSEQLKLFDKRINDRSLQKLITLMLKNGEYGTVESRVNAKNVQGTFVKRMKRRLFPMVVRPGKNKFFEVISYPFRLIWYWVSFVFKNLGYIFLVFKKHSSIDSKEKDDLKSMFDELK